MTEPTTEQLRYRFITGPDDATFCRRVSDLLNAGYELYGPSSLVLNGERTIAGQALVRH